MKLSEDKYTCAEQYQSQGIGDCTPEILFQMALVFVSFSASTLLSINSHSPGVDLDMGGSGGS